MIPHGLGFHSNIGYHQVVPYQNFRRPWHGMPLNLSDPRLQHQHSFGFTPGKQIPPPSQNSGFIQPADNWLEDLLGVGKNGPTMSLNGGISHHDFVFEQEHSASPLKNDTFVGFGCRSVLSGHVGSSYTQIGSASLVENDILKNDDEWDPSQYLVDNDGTDGLLNSQSSLECDAHLADWDELLNSSQQDDQRLAYLKQSRSSPSPYEFPPSPAACLTPPPLINSESGPAFDFEDKRNPQPPKRRRDKDKTRARRPMNPFLLFKKDHYYPIKILLAKQIGRVPTIVETCRAVAEKWKNADMNVKMAYKLQARQLMKEHMDKYPNFNYKDPITHRVDA
jgi:hypothetical protein